MDQMKKEELEITISDSDRIECAIRHIQTAVDVDPWAVEIAVEAMKALEAQEWIPVDKKSHPDTPIRVQVQLDNGWIITAYYDEQEDEWLSVPDCGESIEDMWIEAWRPLPEPYKEDI